MLMLWQRSGLSATSVVATVDAAVVGADSVGCDNSAVKQRTALQWQRHVETAVD